jgi:hypothetical protein
MSSTVSLSRGIGIAIIYATGSLPILWALGVFTFAVRARSYLGYWPTPNHPDPQFLPFDLHTQILSCASGAVLWTLLGVPCFFIVLRKKIDSPLWHRIKRIYAAGLLVILIFTFVPRINFVAWYLD